METLSESTDVLYQDDIDEIDSENASNATDFFNDSTQSYNKSVSLLSGIL